AGAEACLREQPLGFVLPLEGIDILPSDRGGRAITRNPRRHKTIAWVHGAAPDAFGEKLAVDHHGQRLAHPAVIKRLVAGIESIEVTCEARRYLESLGQLGA